MHGPVGMGKTHILQSVCHGLRINNPDIKVLYTSCETFIQLFHAAQRDGSITSFRQHYLDCDAIIFDNIHFMTNQPAVQDEFFNLFNSAHDNHKQLVLASDSSPKRMTGFCDSLLSRFKWGLIVELEPPTPEMRLIIIHKKLIDHDFNMPLEVQKFLANNVTGNIRELEGAIMKLIGYASLLQQNIDLSIAKQVLREYLPNTSNHNISIKEIQTATCEAFNITINKSFQRNRLVHWFFHAI